MLSLISIFLAIIIILALICFVITFFYTLQIVLTKNNNDLFTMMAQNKYYGIFFFGTFVLFGLIFILNNIETNLFRNKILEKLNSYNKKEITLQIAGYRMENDSIKYKILNTEKPSFGRKTGNPEISIALISSDESYNFLLKRDFGNRKKYWVEYQLDEDNYKLIGQIITNQLDDIK